MHKMMMLRDTLMDELEKFAQALLEKETMDISEINELLGRTEPNNAADEGIDITPEEVKAEEVAENADGE